jgi:hypothetical protein
MGFRGPEVQIFSSRPVIEKAFGFSGSLFLYKKVLGYKSGYKIDPKYHIHYLMINYL